MKRIILAVLMVFLAATVACGETYKKGDQVEVQTTDGQWKPATVTRVVTSKDDTGKTWTTYFIDMPVQLQVSDTDAAALLRPKGQSSSPAPAKKQ